MKVVTIKKVTFIFHLRFSKPLLFFLSLHSEMTQQSIHKRAKFTIRLKQHKKERKIGAENFTFSFSREEKISRCLASRSLETHTNLMKKIRTFSSSLMIKFLCFCFVWLNNLPFFHSLWCLLRKHFKTSPSFVTRVLGPCWDDKTWKSPSATEWRAKLTLNFVVRSYATMMTMLSSPVACVKALQMIKENSQNLLSLSSVHYCASYPLVRENSVCDNGDELMMACVMLLSEELIKIYVTPASAAFAQRRRRLCVDKLYKLAHTHDSYSVSSSDDNDDVDEWCLHCRRRHRARCCVSFLSHFSAFHLLDCLFSA